MYVPGAHGDISRIAGPRARDVSLDRMRSRETQGRERPNRKIGQDSGHSKGSGHDLTPGVLRLKLSPGLRESPSGFLQNGLAESNGQ